GGLVVAGMIVIFMGDANWGLKVGIIAAPALIYFLMLMPCRFPVHERVASGVSYRDMLSEFGILGALVVGFLVTLQLMDFFNGTAAFSVTNEAGDLVLSESGQTMLTGTAKGLFVGIGVAIVIAFGAYTRSAGRPLMFLLVLIMMPLATTEIGTDGWITGIMEGVFEMTPEEVTAAGGTENVLVLNGKPYTLHPGWVLVYTSAIMMVLRFVAGPIVHALSPLGLLAVSAILAIVGLITLSTATAAMIFVAATLYALGKTFFWPTMLGVVAEQTPKGGALTLNAISGIGMLAVGTLGFPYIGALQADKQIEAVMTSPEAKKVPGLVVGEELKAVQEKKIYEIIPYETIDPDKFAAAVGTLPAAEQKKIGEAIGKSNQKALADMAIFPGIMLGGYILLILYFKSKGGYQAEVLAGHAAEDEKFTGGVEGGGGA
ncbi:MAG: hypothetical protein OER86_03635, partial [Phycisphaerae bacterium]|nr:hypothetical protein [Phycisphaerae bacterium]